MMSQLSKARPVAGERMVMLQPATLDSLDVIKAARTDLTHELREALKSGLAVDRNVVVLREFAPGVDAALFLLPGGLVVGRITDSAKAKKEHAASTGTMSARPGIYLSDE
jgi:hypothetical protein